MLMFREYSLLRKVEDDEIIDHLCKSSSELARLISVIFESVSKIVFLSCKIHVGICIHSMYFQSFFVTVS